jgi:hypothetical protein
MGKRSDSQDGRAGNPAMNQVNVADAALDTDGDGMGNLAEYRAGTDPDSAQSCLKIESISLEGTTGVQVAWGSASNRLYSVQRASALLAGVEAPSRIWRSKSFRPRRKRVLRRDGHQRAPVLLPDPGGVPVRGLGERGYSRARASRSRRPSRTWGEGANAQTPGLPRRGGSRRVWA